MQDRLRNEGLPEMTGHYNPIIADISGGWEDQHLPRTATLTTTLLVFFCLAAVAIGAAQDSPTPLVGAPEYGVQRDSCGQFVVKVPIDKEAFIAQGSVMEAYLNAGELIRQQKLRKAMDILDSALRRPLDLSAVTPVSTSACDDLIWLSTAVPVRGRIRHLTSDLCDHLKVSQKSSRQEYKRLRGICLQIPLHVANATPADLGNLAEAQGLFRMAMTATEDSLRAYGQSDAAGKVAKAREVVVRRFCSQTSPLMIKYLDAVEAILDVSEKTGTTREEGYRLQRSMVTLRA